MTQLLAHLFGDYILQSDWMAQNKTKRSWPALVHALLYALCFLPLCWVAARHLPERRIQVQPTRFVIHSGDFTSKAVDIDGSYKEPAQDIPGRFRWVSLLVIFGTHFLIDRYRLARYVVWAKNWMGPKRPWYIVKGAWCSELPFGYEAGYVERPTPPLSECPTGYPKETPLWLSTWLLIIADNTLHLAINYAALRWL